MCCISTTFSFSYSPGSSVIVWWPFCLPPPTGHDILLFFRNFRSISCCYFLSFSFHSDISSAMSFWPHHWWAWFSSLHFHGIAALWLCLRLFISKSALACSWISTIFDPWSELIVVNTEAGNIKNHLTGTPLHVLDFFFVLFHSLLLLYFLLSS